MAEKGVESRSSPVGSQCGGEKENGKGKEKEAQPSEIELPVQPGGCDPMTVSFEPTCSSVMH